MATSTNTSHPSSPHTFLPHSLPPHHHLPDLLLLHLSHRRERQSNPLCHLHHPASAICAPYAQTRRNALSTPAASNHHPGNPPPRSRGQSCHCGNSACPFASLCSLTPSLLWHQVRDSQLAAANTLTALSRHVLTLNALDPQPERSGGMQRHPLVVGQTVRECRESGGESKGLVHDSVVAEGSVAGGWGLRRTAGRARTARTKEPPPVMFNICSSVIDKTTAPWQACQ